MIADEENLILTETSCLAIVCSRSVPCHRLELVIRVLSEFISQLSELTSPLPATMLCLSYHRWKLAPSADSSNFYNKKPLNTNNRENNCRFKTFRLTFPQSRAEIEIMRAKKAFGKLANSSHSWFELENSKLLISSKLLVVFSRRRIRSRFAQRRKQTRLQRKKRKANQFNFQ